MKTRTITVEDQTSSGTLAPQELAELTQALSLQAHNHYNTSPWVEHGYSLPAVVIMLPKGIAPSKGSWNIILMDYSSQAGALGFHEDTEGNPLPFSEVFVKTCREDSTPVSECASHEMLEMLVDPWVNSPRTVNYNGKDYIVEVGDPVQGCGYDIGNGQIVADFVWPRWFGLGQSRPQFSQRESVSKPFELAPQGYISVKPTGGNENEWTQIFGEMRTVLPRWASRLPRIHTKQ